MKKFAGTWIAVAVFGALLAYLLIAKPKSADEKKQDALTLTSSKRETIDRVELKNANGEFTIVRVSGGPPPSPAPSPRPPDAPEVWKITAPREYPLEDSALSQMKNALSDLVATDPVWSAPTEEEKKQVGLDTPVATVKWHAGDGEHTMLVGKPFPKNDQVYAQVSGNAGIYLVRKYAVEIFTKGLNDLRRHKIFDLDRDAVRNISIETKDGKKLVAARADELAPWQATSPFSGRADRGKLNNLIAKVAALRAEAFVDAVNPKALEKPRATITLGTAATLVIGDDDAMGGGKWIGTDRRTGQVFVASTDLPTDLKTPLTEWRDHSLFDFPIEDVSTLELTVGGSTYGFHRDDLKNFIANAGGNVNTEASQFLRVAKTANVTERSEKGSFGFEKPSFAASWVVGSGDQARKIEIVGGAAKGASRWVKTNEMAAAQLVPDDVMMAANALAAAVKPAVATSSGAPASTSKPGG